MLDGWRPISEAPKGPQILAFARGYADHEFYGVAQWAPEELQIRPGSVAGWFWSYAIRPTHWQPLPTPPLSLQEEK